MTTVPTQHSSLVGGSTAARRLGCQRSWALEQFVRERSSAVDSSSVYAQEGTCLHELLGYALEKDLEPRDLIPFTFTSEKEGWSFTVDMDLWEDKGEPALRTFDTFVAEQEGRLGDEMKFLIETRVEFPGIPGAFGTSDIIGRCGNEIFVIDWKFGRGVVPAEENKQLMFYASGALNTAKAFFKGMDLTADTPITMVIIQPMRPGGIDVWPTTLQRLYRYKEELQRAIKVIQDKGMDAPIQDGPWCQFATCKVACPLHIGAAAKLASNFERLKAATEKKAPPINDWPERLADMLDMVDMVEEWCKEVRGMAHENAERGMEIPGWVLEPGRKGPRKWAIDEAEVVETFTSDEFGLTKDEVAPRKPLTLPQLEKILKRKDKTIPDGFTTQSESTTTRLVRAENAKEVVEPSAAKVQSLADKLSRL
jgi:hypothetical protein